MLPSELFRFCPRCGNPVETGANPLRCPDCDFCFFFNPTVAAAAFVFDTQGNVIVIRRAKEPQMGKLTIPGGFLDIGETAESGLAREIREEVGLEVNDIRFLTSKPNLYPFRGVTYPVCDLIFTAKAENPEAAAALDGATEFAWIDIEKLDSDEIAFASVQKGLILLKGGT